jgi:Spy/CpxP family protein refolding chaperone
MKNKTLILIISAMIILTGTTFGAGYISKHMRQGFGMVDNNMIRGQMLLRLKTELKLTDDQVKKIEKMSFNFQESVIKRMADTKIMEIKLANYLRGDKINRKTVEKMIKDIAMMKADMQIDRIYHFLDIKSVLTPEQIKKAEELKKTYKRRSFFRNQRDKKGDRRSNRRSAER